MVLLGKTCLHVMGFILANTPLDISVSPKLPYMLQYEKLTCHVVCLLNRVWWTCTPACHMAWLLHSTLAACNSCIDAIGLQSGLVHLAAHFYIHKRKQCISMLLILC